MRDDEIGTLIRRSMDRHVHDVQPAPDLGEWVIERGRVVRRRRQATAAAGGLAAVAVVAGAVFMVPRLGDHGDTPAPAGVPSTTHRTPGPVRTAAPTRGPSPTAVPRHHRSGVPVTPTPSTTSPTPTDTSTSTGTATDTPTTTPAPAPADTAPTGDAPTTAPDPAPSDPAVTTPAGPSIQTPYGTVPYPAGTSTTIASATVGSHFVALVGGDAGHVLLSVASDGSAVDMVTPAMGTVNSFVGSPNGRFVATAVEFSGGAYLQVQRVGHNDSASVYNLPAGYSGHINGWTSDGIVVDMDGPVRQLRWSFDRGTIETRASSADSWSAPTPAA